MFMKSNLAFIFIGIVAFLIVIQSKIALLSFIPGGFCGAALTAASGVSDVKGYLLVALSLVAGAVLGYVSELGAGVLAKKTSACGYRIPHAQWAARRLTGTTTPATPIQRAA